MPDALSTRPLQAVIIATGESLTEADVDAAWRSGRKIFAVNDAYRLCPCADVLYACDEQWWDLHEKPSRVIAERWTTCDVAAQKYGLRHIPGQHHTNDRRRFDASGHGIVYGGNGGFQALNLAYALGVRDAILLGFDCEGTHFFGDHPPAICNPSPFADWLDHWKAAAPEIAAAGMVVRNATRGGKLECFPRVSLEAV
jgi:hypothetical protein